MAAIDRFVQDTLEQEGARMVRNQGAAIYVAYERRTGRLLSERKVSVSGGDRPVLTFQHVIYERFLDLKKKGGRDRRIHNRFVYGTYSAISRRLMYGYTDDVAKLFREVLIK